ncbi:MAG: phosphatase PAP2 family protein [Methylomonas sp.]|nr:phosphatase PAP2 family protein [Methylomonas sp.]
MKTAWATVACWLGIGLLPVVERLTAPPWGADEAVLAFFVRLHHPALDGFFIAATWAGSLYLLMPLTVVMVLCFIRRGQASAAWLLGLSVTGVSVLAHGMKLMLERPRPSLYASLTALPADASFPSAHTAQITAFVVAVLSLCVRGNWLAWIGIVLAVAVGLSRIYLQVHYASDVLAGVLLGVFWAGGIRQCQRWIHQRTDGV